MQIPDNVVSASKLYVAKDPYMSLTPLPSHENVKCT